MTVHPFEGMAAVLRRDPGIYLGEKHSYYSHMQWFADHIPAFHKEGVRQVFMESILQKDQWLVDDYMNHVPGAEERLKSHIAHRIPDTVSPIPVFNLIKACKEQGIKVVGIDIPPDDFPHLTFAQARGAVNEDWAKLVNEHRADLKPGEKFLVIGGAAHGYLRVDQNRGYPSINEWLGITSYDFTVPGCLSCSQRIPQSRANEIPVAGIMAKVPKSNHFSMSADYEVMLPPHPLQNRHDEKPFGVFEYQPTYTEAELEAYKEARTAMRITPEIKASVSGATPWLQPAAVKSEGRLQR